MGKDILATLLNFVKYPCSQFPLNTSGKHYIDNICTHTCTTVTQVDYTHIPRMNSEEVFTHVCLNYHHNVHIFYTLRLQEISMQIYAEIPFSFSL